MAKTSGKPGKTRLLNYFVVDNRYYLVDLPGYGFAKVSKTQRKEWARLMRAYLFSGDRPLAVFQLLDARRDPTEEDRQMHDWLREAELPYALVPTKIDKIGKTKRMARYREIAEAMRPAPDTPFLPTSAELREGAEALHGWVEALLEQVAE
jgi:GTP-binding protein